jgi:hypothetical protein
MPVVIYRAFFLWLLRKHVIPKKIQKNNYGAEEGEPLFTIYIFLLYKYPLARSRPEAILRSSALIVFAFLLLLPTTECPKHNTGIAGGAHSAQEGTWAVRLTCTSHAQSPPAHPLISELRVRFLWDGFTQQQQMALLLRTMPQDPVAQRHKQWFRTILPQCHALAARITLTVQKELQMLAVQTGVSAGQLRAAASASQVAASRALIQAPSPMTMSSEDEE